jgi:hypothetical protein
MNARPYDQYRETPLWRAVSETVRELQATGELKIETGPDYVIGYMCQELAQKWVVAAESLRRIS